MKVIFITTESLMDHSYTMSEELKKFLDFEVIMTARLLTPEIEDFCKKLNAVFIKRRRFINPFAFINELKLMFYIKRQKADVVWFNTFSLYQSMLAKFFFSTIIVNAHDIDLHPEESDYHGIASQKITFSFYKKSVAVMSRTQQKIFEEKYGFKPALLQLPLINYYESSAHSANAAPNPNDGIRFFFFGTVLPYKGLERLLDAAEILQKKNLNFELSINGRIKYKAEEFKERIKKIKNIVIKDEFIDYRDVYKVYSSGDVIIIPYIHVSQCGPLLIGYNQNVPVICSDLTGFREYVEDGKSGLLFDNTAEGLADKMEMIIKNPEMIQEMSRFIKNNTRGKFSMQSLANEYISVFKNAQS